MSYKKGSMKERKIEQRLWDAGWQTFRVAGSGSVGHASADLVALKDGRVLVLESKSSKGFPVEVDLDQLDTIENRGGDGVEVWVVADVAGHGLRMYKPKEKIREGDDGKFVYEVIR